MTTHLEAVEATITAAGTIMDGRHTALIQLVRTLAGQMDAAGADPSTRLSAAYLSTLKDLGRVMAVRAPGKPGNSLDELRQRREALPMRRTAERKNTARKLPKP